MMTNEGSTETQPLEQNPVPEGMQRAESLVVVNTGDGKGKSSAAFGVMLRGLAMGWRVAVVQFIKSGDWKVGEEKMGRQLGVEWFAEGEGFTWDSDNIDQDKAVANKGWQQAKALINSGNHPLIVLDELTYLMNWGWIDSDDVVATIKNRPAATSLVITGRDASEELQAVADTVTEMRKVRHAFDTGIVAKKGIDY